MTVSVYDDDDDDTAVCGTCLYFASLNPNASGWWSSGTRGVQSSGYQVFSLIFYVALAPSWQSTSISVFL